MLNEKLKSKKNIIILTGAGVSVASGLHTYRGTGGIWDTHEVEKYGYVDALKESPQKVWELFGSLREEAQKAVPNKTHYILPELEQNLRDNQSMLLITQNVDGLHKLAGSENLIELHGNIHQTVCTNENCTSTSFHNSESHVDSLPRCSVCGELLRPDIIMFGEQIPIDKEWAIKKALRDCDLFMSIGTSGTVAPASNYVRSAKYSEAETVSINIEKQVPRNKYFDHELIGDGDSVLLDYLS